MGNPWNERFGAEQYVYGEEPNEFILSQAYRLKNLEKIVAFAEGEGRNAVFLARQSHDVTAYDYAVNGLRKTEALADRYGVRVIRTGVRNRNIKLSESSSCLDRSKEKKH